MDEDALKNLLTAVEEAEAAESGLREDPNFLCDTRTKLDGGSEVHTGLTDSSDDEDNRDFELQKYNTFGKSIKSLLPSPSSSSSSSSASATWDTKCTKPPVGKQLQAAVHVEIKEDVHTDPIFGIRIVNPLISSVVLKERMQGRLPVPMLKLRKFVEAVPADTDWVIAGVIVHKTGRTSQKGNPFSIFTLSDLHGDLKTVTVFLFGSAYKELWKSTPGTVIGVLNPSIFEKKQGSKDEACLSVDNIQKVMIFGKSKDFGFCKSLKKDGTSCASFVNVSRCEFCIYHIKQEYQKCSKRSELQSTFSGRGLNALRNKVLGKNEVFYAGKSFTAMPATKSRKLREKDEGRLSLLMSQNLKTTSTARPKNSTNAPVRRRGGLTEHVEISASRRLKDIELLKKLGGCSDLVSNDKVEKPNAIGKSADVTLAESKNAALSVIEKLKAKKSNNKVETNLNSKEQRSEAVPDILDEHNLSDVDFDLSDDEAAKSAQKKGKENKTDPVEKPALPLKKLAPVNKYAAIQPIKTPVVAPTLSKPSGPTLSGHANQEIDLSAPISKKLVNRAKFNALTWVAKHGPIQKQDPNKTLKGGKKRVLEVVQEKDPKRKKIQENEHFSQRFKQMMAATSAHKDLLDDHDNNEVEKYFNKLEMKERMEEKMTSTYKVECKAVKCLQCKYTSFSAADRCKVEKHPLKVFDTMKRFFKCGDCGNRTCCLTIFPTNSCKKCGSGKWEKTGMMREKCIVPRAELSIRGGEQTFVNSQVTNANINLLVPDEN